MDLDDALVRLLKLHPNCVKIGRCVNAATQATRLESNDFYGHIFLNDLLPGVMKKMEEAEVYFRIEILVFEPDLAWFIW